MKLVLVASTCIVLSSSGPAQDVGAERTKGASLHHSRPLIVSRSAQTESPVTAAEASASFTRAEAVIRKALDLPNRPVASRIKSTNSPVKRSQVVAEMARLLRDFDPQLKMTPRAVSYDPAVLNIDDRSELVDLNRLVKLGTVGRVSRLATGPSASISVDDFSDALGFFMCRLTQLTHLPSNKWTPWLRSED